MDFVVLILIIALLLMFGYAQLQKDVVKIPGKITLNEADDSSPTE